MPPITFADVAMFYMGCSVLVYPSISDGKRAVLDRLNMRHLAALQLVTPFLRPLTSASRQECIAIAKLLGYKQTKVTTETILARRGRLFCENNGLIQLTSVQQMSRLTAYLTKQQFDIFNLIDNGFAKPL